MLHHHHTDKPDPAYLAAHADVEALYNRLGHDVSTLDDAGEPANRQALVDAGERYNTAGAQLGQATTTGELSVVRGIVVEGLQSTRLVRTRLGLDPGPDPALTAAPTAPDEPVEPHRWGGDQPHHAGSGLGAALGAGMAGGLLGSLLEGGVGEFLGGDGGGNGF